MAVESTSIGKKVRQIRKENNLPQKAFASLFNMSQQNLSRYENGKFQIPYNDLMRITDCPIIFITTLQGLEAHLLRQVHCYDYIEKPLGDGSLVKERLQEVLDALAGDRRRSQRECVPVRHDGIGYAVYLDEVLPIGGRLKKRFREEYMKWTV